MAKIGGEHDLAPRLAGQHTVGEIDRAVVFPALDHRPIAPRLEGLTRRVAQAEPPTVAIIGRDIGNQVRLVRDRMQVRLQVFQIQLDIDRDGIVDHLHVGAVAVGDDLPVRSGQEGPGQGPFRGHDPVEHRRAAGDPVPTQRHISAEDVEAFAQARAGDTARDRKQPVEQARQKIRVNRLDRRQSGFGRGLEHVSRIQQGPESTNRCDRARRIRSDRPGARTGPHTSVWPSARPDRPRDRR